MMNKNDDHDNIASNQRLCNNSYKREFALQGISALSMSDTSRPGNMENAGSTNLGELYEPNSNDVICGRGRRAWDHKGNTRFRCLLERYRADYENAKTKLNKSLLVSKIMEDVEEANPPGRFIKQDERGEWTMVSLATAREKVGQGFRDLLHAKYKSSFTAKKCRRSQEIKMAAIERSGTITSTTISSPDSSGKASSKRMNSPVAASTLSAGSSLGSIGYARPPKLILSESGRGQSDIHLDLPLNNRGILAQVVNFDRHHKVVESSTEFDDQHELRLEPLSVFPDSSHTPLDLLVTRRREPPYGDSSNVDLNNQFDDALDQQTTLQLFQKRVWFTADQPPEAVPSSDNVSLTGQQQSLEEELHHRRQQQQQSIGQLGSPPRINSSAGESLHQAFFPMFVGPPFGGDATVNSTTTTPTNLLMQQHLQRMQQGMGDMNTVSTTSSNDGRALAHQQFAVAWGRSHHGSSSAIFPQQQFPCPKMLEEQDLQQQNHAMSMSTIRNPLSTLYREDLQQSISLNMPGIVQLPQHQQQHIPQAAPVVSGVGGACEIQHQTIFQPITEPTRPQRSEDIYVHTGSILQSVSWPDQWPFEDEDKID